VLCQASSIVASNDGVSVNDLYGRSIYGFRRVPWLQSDGQALDLQNRRIHTYRTSKDSDNPIVGEDSWQLQNQP